MKNTTLSSLLILSFILVGCSLFPSSENNWGGVINTETFTTITGSRFSLSIPKQWKAVSQNDLPAPTHGMVVWAYSATDISKAIVSNLIILREELTNIITSAKYTEVNRVQAQRQYIDYTHLSTTPIKFSDWDTADVTTFEARYNEKTPKALFVQTAKVCGVYVYLITMTLPLGTDTSPLMPVFGSFMCWVQ